MAIRPSWFSLVLALSLILSLTGPTIRAQSPADAPAQTPEVFVTANGISLQAGQPLPVFRFSTPSVTSGQTAELARLFTSVSGQTVMQDMYADLVRFTVPNTRTNTVLERYTATGGFYLYNASEAFAETVRPNASFNRTQAQSSACQFLFNNGLIPQNVNIPGTAQQCSPDVFRNNPYATSGAWAATLEAASGRLTQQQIGLIVRVPMSLNTGAFSQVPSVPLGGPGGHISLYFRTLNTNDSGFTLDSGTPGLAAAALPFYSRQFSHVRNVPTLSVATVTQQVGDAVRASYPGATITVTTPSLYYFVSDAGTPQTALEPTFAFEGIEVTTGGETFVLRDIVLPAAQSGPQGFGPLVTITAPVNGSSFTPGATVNFSASLSGGAAPYTFTWRLDNGTPLATGVAANASQPITLATNQLPAVSHSGLPAPVTVQLQVQDSDGAIRTANVVLNPTVAPSLYLPLIQRNAGRGSALAAADDPPANLAPMAASAQVLSSYTFGVVQASDYPPYGIGGSDLPGVVPDVTGFRNGMQSAGWSRQFHWANSSAWERDWRDCSLGGMDCTDGVDRADFVYYAGHGGPGGLSLPSSKDSTWFSGNNARFQSLRWVGFSSCQTLRVQGYTAGNEPIRRWFNAFQGAHMLLGFNSNMADIAFGGPLVDNMRMPILFGIPYPWAQRTIREAWVHTAFNMNAGKPAYIYARGTNGVNPANDKLPSPAYPQAVSRPFPVASWHWVWWEF